VFETRDKTTLNHRSTTFIIIIEHSGDGFIVVIIVYTDIFIILTLYICKKKNLNGWVRPFLIQTLSETTQLFQSAIDYKHRPKRGCGDKIFMMI